MVEVLHPSKCITNAVALVIVVLTLGMSEVEMYRLDNVISKVDFDISAVIQRTLSPGFLLTPQNQLYLYTAFVNL